MMDDLTEKEREFLAKLRAIPPEYRPAITRLLRAVADELDAQHGAVKAVVADGKPAHHFTVRALAERWGVSRAAVYRLVARGDLRRLPLGSTIRIPQWIVEEFERCPAAPQTSDRR